MKPSRKSDRTSPCVYILVVVFVIVTIAGSLFCSVFANQMLLYKATNGNSGSIRRLISSGADINTVDNNRTPLLYAIEGHEIENAIALINGGADVNFAQKDNKNTPLMAAAYYGEMPVVKLLVSRGANINARDIAGESVLGWAEDGRKDGYGAEAEALLKKLGAVK